MPHKELVARCINSECQTCLKKELTWEGTGIETVFDHNSPLIKRLAMHHHAEGTGHGLYLLFNSLEEAKKIDQEALSWVEATGVLEDFYFDKPAIIGHVCVSRQAENTGQIFIERVTNTSSE